MATSRIEAHRRGWATLFKLISILFSFAFLFWHWAGNNPIAKCTVTCCVILPFVSGGLCCLLLGETLRRSGGRLSHRADQTVHPRMDVPLLGGMVLGTTAACGLTSMCCQMMCRMFQVTMSMSPCRAVLPGLIFAGMSAAIVYIMVFEAEQDEGVKIG